MECNKFSDNLQNCTIQTSHNRFRNDRPTCSARNTETRNTVSRHGFHAQYPPASWRRNNNSTAFLLFSRTHSSLYRRELHPRVHGLPRKRPSSFPTMASREGGRHNSNKFIARPSASTTSATLYSQGKIHEKAKSRPAVVSIGNGIRQ